MAQQQPDLTIRSLRGGMNNTDPPHALDEDQCVLAENVEFWRTTCGERRLGSTAVSLTSASLTDESAIVHLSQWFPTNNATIPEWWAVAATPGTSVSVAKKLFDTWTTESPNDAINTSLPDVYNISTQALGSLLFWSYRSAVDRLHVWDGNVWRRTGLAQPVAPTAANHGSGGYATVRYFRVRFVEVNLASVVVRRSEPSTSLAFTPSGSGDGATVTKPAGISEGETHWELEASTDNATFYRIARTAVGTTTYLDTTAFAAGYAGGGPVSEEIGAYTLQSSAKYLAVDGDRLLLASHWTDTSLMSTVSWTPVEAATGVGNSERLPFDLDNTLDLDGYEGGTITGIAPSVYGLWYVFKWSHIYQMTRTGDPTKAYDALTISKTRGALPGTIVPGADRNGDPCTFFIDPRLGPSCIGNEGIQTITGLDQTWKRANLLATIPGHGVYYADKRQLHWWIAIDGASTPNYELVLQVNQTTSSSGTLSRGWSVATGGRANAYCSAILTENVFLGGSQTLSNLPYIGKTTPDYMQRCDTGQLDGSTPFRAQIVTKPYIAAGILNKWGSLRVALLAAASSGKSILVRLIRDYGAEYTGEAVVTLTATGTETDVIRLLDEMTVSGCTAIQVMITDPH